jgi:uncharacterized cofD-like protein
VLAITGDGCKQIAEHAEHVIDIPNVDPCFLSCPESFPCNFSLITSLAPAGSMLIGRETLPKQSQSNCSVVVLGGGRGLASVLRALRDEDSRLTVIVSIAYAGQHGGDAQHRLTGAAVEDLRRSLEALTGEDDALLRAIKRPLTIESLGRHPLGNLLIASVAKAFGDYGRASTWLGEQLGIGGAVLPATVEPVQVQIESVEEVPTAESSGGSERKLSRLRFVGERAESPEAAVAAIEHAQWALLAPGSLYRSVIPAAGVPDLVSVLRSTAARVLWIANLEADSGEAANMLAIDQLLALQLQAIRVDAVMHDPSATLRFDPADLTAHGVESIRRKLASTANPAVHDPGQLRLALRELIGSRPAGNVGARGRDRDFSPRR